ncbi:MAG TPA: hypothetical protein VFI30_08785 [Nocardioidaceae bacterium]|nr:hypothetical protein [Nocardioidaceae bacterium]
MTRHALERHRDALAIVALLVAALFFVAGLGMIFKSANQVGGPFTLRAAAYGHLFSAPLLILGLVAAVALASGFERPSRNARAIVGSAAGLGALSLLFGVISWFAALAAGQSQGPMFAGIFGAGKIVGALLGAATLLALGLVCFYSSRVYRMLLPTTSAYAEGPSWAGAGGWSPGQQPGWPPPGQGGWAQPEHGAGQPGQPGWSRPGPGGWGGPPDAGPWSPAPAHYPPQPGAERPWGDSGPQPGGQPTTGQRGWVGPTGPPPPSTGWYSSEWAPAAPTQPWDTPPRPPVPDDTAAKSAPESSPAGEPSADNPERQPAPEDPAGQPTSAAAQPPREHPERPA